jgi:hypothetical protein
MDGGQCEEHDEKKKMMLVIGNMICVAVDPLDCLG